MELSNKLRMYAVDLHVMGGFNKYSVVMSEAADKIDRLERVLEETMSSATLYSNLWKEYANE